MLAAMGLLLNVAADGRRAARGRGPHHGREPTLVPTRIVIAAGGTAGHVVPALAVADALRAEGAEVVFVGGERAEAELVPAAGYELQHDPRRGPRPPQPAARGARALARPRAAVGARRAAAARAAPGRRDGRRRLRRRAGRAAAAVLRRVPLVLTEADCHLGLDQPRCSRPFARRVCLAFPIAGRGGERYRVTGRPVPPPATDRAAARERFGLGAEETCVLVFGGSLGARSINEAAVEAFADAPFRVLHVAGARDFAALRARARGPHYDLRAYLTIERSARRCWPPTSSSRAPGGSVFEIAAHGRPAILVPYPHATGRPPDDQRPLDGRRRRGGRDRRRRADGPRLAREVGASCSPTAAAWPRWRAPRPRSRAPTRAREVAEEVLAAAGEWLTGARAYRLVPRRPAPAPPQHVAPRRRPGGRGDGRSPTSR